jgi:hypothetical protein
MGKKLRVKFMLVLLSLGLMAVFMGGCVIPDDLEAFIEGLMGPRIIQPSPEVLLPSPDGLLPSEGELVPMQNGMLPLQDGQFPFPLI